MQKRTLSILITMFILLVALVSVYSPTLFSKAKTYKPYKYIELEKVSRYNENRIAFQRIEEFIDPLMDNSVEALLIIRSKKMYLIKDGYDKLGDIKTQRLILDMENQLYEDEELWINKINGNPDFIKVTERRVELMTNSNEDFVSKNFGTFYKSIRNSFIQRHVSVFRQLMRNRRESGLYVERRRIPKPVYVGAKPSEQKQLFSTSAVAKTIDDTKYYCEDADGDGVTETFTVTRPDGFDWGYQSGPNIIFIYKNSEKDIETLIGKLAYESLYGSVEEERDIIKSFPKQDEVVDFIQKLVPDEKFVK